MSNQEQAEKQNLDERILMAIVIKDQLIAAQDRYPREQWKEFVTHQLDLAQEINKLLTKPSKDKP